MDKDNMRFLRFVNQNIVFRINIQIQIEATFVFSSIMYTIFEPKFMVISLPKTLKFTSSLL